MMARGGAISSTLHSSNALSEPVRAPIWLNLEARDEIIQRSMRHFVLMENPIVLDEIRATAAVVAADWRILAGGLPMISSCSSVLMIAGHHTFVGCCCSSTIFLMMFGRRLASLS